MIDGNRFFDAFPAGNYAISGWLRLMAFQESREVQTAAIQSGRGHVILVNPDFVARYAPTPERQVALVLHELMHLLLGHQLRPVTRLDNLVFDAVINALLCRMLRDPAYWSLFTSYYSANHFPQCLLRPPANYEPDRPVSSPRGLSGSEFTRLRAIYRDLYGEHGATYTELREALVEFTSTRSCHLQPPPFPGGGGARGASTAGGKAQPSPGDDDLEEPRPEDGPGRGGSRGVRSRRKPPDLFAALGSVPLLGEHPVRADALAEAEPEWLQCLKASLQALIQAAGGRSPFGWRAEFTFPPHPGTERRHTILLRRLIERVASGGHALARKYHQDRIRTAGVLPAIDRKSNILRFLGLQPLLYTWDVPLKTRVGIEKVHLYVDVSGSVYNFVPAFYQAVLGCRALVHPKVHLFSTVVEDATWRDLLRGRLKTTGGTDINCVLAHMERHRIRRAVILTDGNVGHPQPGFTPMLQSSVVGVALTPSGYRGYLRDHVRHWENLQAPWPSEVAEETGD